MATSRSNQSICLCAACEKFTEESQPAPLHKSLQGLANPYPDILNSRYLNAAETDYLESGRARCTVLNEDAEPHYDVRIIEDDDKVHPDDISDYLAAKDILRKSPSWKTFCASVLPECEGVPITSAVCLGPGSGMSSSISYKERERFFYEVAGFQLLVEAIQQSQMPQDSNETLPIHTVFQDPRFEIADARFLEVLTGGDIVRHPHAYGHIGPNTFIYGLHMEHAVMWNFVLQDTNVQPAMSLGNNLFESQAWLMADIFVEAIHTGSDLNELHDLHIRSSHYLDSHGASRVPTVTVPSQTFFGNVELFKAAQLRRVQTTKGPPSLLALTDSLSWGSCLPNYLDERELVTARELSILRNYCKREPFVLPQDDKEVFMNTDTKPKRTSVSKHTPWQTERAGILQSYGLDEDFEGALSEVLKNRVYDARDRYIFDRQWKAFNTATRKALLESPTDNIICLGIGTFFRATSAIQMYQFIEEIAAVLAVQALMAEQTYLDLVNASAASSRASGAINMFFQDPRFGFADARLIECLGGRCCIGNHGAKLINSSSFVFAKGLPWDVVWDVSIRGSGPGIWLGSGLVWTINQAIATAYIDGDYAEMEEVKHRSDAFIRACSSTKLETPPPTDDLDKFFRGTWSQQELWWKTSNMSESTETRQVHRVSRPVPGSATLSSMTNKIMGCLAGGEAVDLTSTALAMADLCI